MPNHVFHKAQHSLVRLKLFRSVSCFAERARPGPASQLLEDEYRSELRRPGPPRRRRGAVRFRRTAVRVPFGAWVKFGEGSLYFFSGRQKSLTAEERGALAHWNGTG